MPKRLPYWTTAKPSNAERWAGMQSGALLDPDLYHERLFHLYRRYVKQWNDIELDRNRGLNEHTNQICGAEVSGASKKFIVSSSASSNHAWLLEIIFGRGFSQYYPGLSCGLNAMRTPADINRVLLHWSDSGRSDFEQWLEQEEQTKTIRGEWTEYKAS